MIIYESYDLFLWHYLVLTGLSFLTCGLVLMLCRYVPRLLGRMDQLKAVQAMHTRPTSRLGGLGIFVALLATLLVAPVSHDGPYRDFLVATSVLFFVGLAEDLGFGVSPRWRLLAALVASLLVIVLLQLWMPRTGIPGLDALVHLWWVGVPVTLLVTAGMANGFNMIDGVNGLAGLSAVVAGLCLSLIAHEAGFSLMVHLAAMLSASVLGFLVWNYPFGKIFLGDAGAYTLGFVLSWFAIAILLNAPSSSPFALLLTLFWPAADIILAIWRRVSRRAPTMAPDRLHAHQLLMRALEIYILGRGRRHIANPLTTLLLAPFVVVPPVTGVLLWDNNFAAFWANFGFITLFFGSYFLSFVVLTRLSRRRSQVEGAKKSGDFY